MCTETNQQGLVGILDAHGLFMKHPCREYEGGGGLKTKEETEHK